MEARSNRSMILRLFSFLVMFVHLTTVVLASPFGCLCGECGATAPLHADPVVSSCCQQAEPQSHGEPQQSGCEISVACCCDSNEVVSPVAVGSRAHVCEVEQVAPLAHSTPVVMLSLLTQVAPTALWPPQSLAVPPLYLLHSVLLI